MARAPLSLTTVTCTVAARWRLPILEHRVAAALVVEAKQVALRVLLAAVVVGADLGDLAVADQEPLGAAVEPLLAALGSRQVIVHSIATWSPCSIAFSMYHWASIVLDAERGVAADRLGALVRAEARVVVDRVVGEVRRDRLGVAVFSAS